MNDDGCIECGKVFKKIKYVRDDGNGLVEYCSLKCAKKDIRRNWRNFIEKVEVRR